MIISKKKHFLKSYAKLPRKIQDKADEVLYVFSCSPFHSSLRNHALHGEYAGFRSIDVTGDYRIIFQELSNGLYELVELINIGSHSDLY